MRKNLVFLLAVLWQLPSMAADRIPEGLTGSWSTAESLYAGSTGQTEMHLLADGFGVLAGSTPPAQENGGAPADPGVHAPRAIIGFPFQATLQGGELIVRPFIPKAGQSPMASDMVLSCRYVATAPSITCKGPDGVPMVLARRSKKVPDEVVRMIDHLRPLS
ncbi:hypothetical protein ACHMW6_08500 [Pseudoduganella sp. UC29_106]|uniref:hypothetical protein n=1 Tax=Pseudoduganella sp. UC29_106 TaxID=3374553 RepID=UPI003756667A